LEIAAHRQGFASLAEVKRAVLEPGGGVSFVGKEPTKEAIAYQEIIKRLELVTQELAALRAAQEQTQPANAG
jgi:uncharacterized membrane protein YcaP (DUF421 family)